MKELRRGKSLESHDGRALRLQVSFWVWVLWLGMACPSSQAESANPLLRQLVEQGVPLDDTVRASLATPRMPDGLAADEQGSIVRRAAGQYGTDRFVRNSVVAPFSLDVQYIKDAAGTRMGHAVDLAFVAYGSLDQLRDRGRLRELFDPLLAGKEEGLSAVQELDEATVSRQGVQRYQGEHVEQRFVSGKIELLDRVAMSGVVQVVTVHTKHSVSVAWALDERFAEHAELRGVWRAIQVDQLGRRTLGPRHAYQGYAGYLKVTPLDIPEGALFVESRVVFHEPEGWFTGSNLLRAKLPLAVQQAVRTFRRQLAGAADN